MSTSTAAATTRTPVSEPSLWPDASLLGVALIWGINIPLMKIGLEQVDVFVFNAVRLAISAAVLVLFAIWERRSGIRPQPGLRFRQVVVYAVFVSAMYQLTFLMGIAKTTSGNTALIIATVPMWTALMARVFLGEQLLRLAWIGLAIALTGTVIVALQKGDVTAGSEHLLGNVIVLLSALLWSGGTVYSRPMLQYISPMQLAAIATAMALPVHCLFGWGGYQSSLPALSSWSLWLIIVYSGVLSSGLAQPMWSYGVRHAGAAHAAINQNLIPVVAIVAAWLSRGETPTIAQLCGGTMILGGLIMMRRSRSAEASRLARSNS